MAQRSQCILLILLKAGHPECVESRLTMTLATYNEESYSRAVFNIKGEAGRLFGTRHRVARESAQNLLNGLPQPYRISNAELIRVLGLVEGPTPPSSHGSQPRSPRGGPTPPSGHGSQPRSIRGGGPGEGPVPVLDGSQPSERPCGRFSGKRKLNEEDVVKNPRATKKPAIHLKPSERRCRRFSGKRKLNEEDVVKHPVGTKQPEPLERGEVAGLHYFLRTPLDAGSQPRSAPAPLLLFLHGAGERGKDDGTELHKVRKHGPWKCHGADQFFILAPQCPKRRVWPVLVDEVLLVLEHVCKRDDVDKLRFFALL